MLASNKIDTLKSLGELHKTIQLQNIQIQKEIGVITNLIKDKKTSVLQNANQTGPVSSRPKQKVDEGNLSSYRTSNIDYGSLLEDDSYYSEY